MPLHLLLQIFRFHVINVRNGTFINAPFRQGFSPMISAFAIRPSTPKKGMQEKMNKMGAMVSVAIAVCALSFAHADGLTASSPGALAVPAQGVSAVSSQGCYSAALPVAQQSCSPLAAAQGCSQPVAWQACLPNGAPQSPGFPDAVWRDSGASREASAQSSAWQNDVTGSIDKAAPRHVTIAPFDSIGVKESIAPQPKPSLSYDDAFRNWRACVAANQGAANPPPQCEPVRDVLRKAIAGRIRGPQAEAAAAKHRS